MGPNKYWIGVALCGGLLLFSLCLNITEPWIAGHYGNTGSMRNLIGRNYLWHGFRQVRMAPIQNDSFVEPRRFSYRWNHPMAVNVLVGISYHIFGESAWSTRLPFVLFSFLMGLWMFGVAYLMWGRQVAAWTLCFVAFSPLLGIYGSMPNYEPVGLAAVIGSLYYYIRWIRFSEVTSFFGVLILCSLSMWTDWPGWIFAFFLFLWMLLYGKQMRWAGAWKRFGFPFFYAFFVLLNAGAFAWYSIAVLGVNRAKVEALFKFRSGASGSLVETARIIFNRSTLLLSPLLVTAAVLLVLAYFGRYAWSRQRRKTLHFSLLMCLLAPALLYIYVFKGQVAIHCFSAFHLLFFVVFAAAIATTSLLRWSASRHRRLPAVLGCLGLLLLVGTTSYVTFEGKYTNGSPFEGRKSITWRPYMFARWLRTQTDPTERVLLIGSFPQNLPFSTHLARPHSYRSFYSLKYALRSRQYGAIAVAGESTSRREIPQLMKKYPFAVFDSYVVFFPKGRLGGERIQVWRHELRPFTWFHGIFHSLTMPPMELRASDILAAKYWFQHGGSRPRAVDELKPSSPTTSPLEQLMLYNALLWRDKAAHSKGLARLAAKIEGQLEQRVGRPLGPHLMWCGLQTREAPSGHTRLSFLFRLRKPLPAKIPHVFMRLRDRSREVVMRIRWKITRQPGLKWRAGEYILSHRLVPKRVKPGIHRVLLMTRAGNSRFVSHKNALVRVRYRPFLKLREKIVGERWYIGFRVLPLLGGASK